MNKEFTKEFLEYYFKTYNEYYKDKECLDVSLVKFAILSSCGLYLSNGTLLVEYDNEIYRMDVHTQYNDFKLLKREQNLKDLLND